MAIAGVDIEWHEGDVESLPFGDDAFDTVLSQFGHIFAPRHEVATREMLRVLNPVGSSLSRHGRPKSASGGYSC